MDYFRDRNLPQRRKFNLSLKNRNHIKPPEPTNSFNLTNDSYDAGESQDFRLRISDSFSNSFEAPEPPKTTRNPRGPKSSDIILISDDDDPLITNNNRKKPQPFYQHSISVSDEDDSIFTGSLTRKNSLSPKSTRISTNLTSDESNFELKIDPKETDPKETDVESVIDSSYTTPIPKNRSTYHKSLIPVPKSPSTPSTIRPRIAKRFETPGSAKLSQCTTPLSKKEARNIMKVIRSKRMESPVLPDKRQIIAETDSDSVVTDEEPDRKIIHPAWIEDSDLETSSVQTKLVPSKTHISRFLNPEPELLSDEKQREISRWLMSNPPTDRTDDSISIMSASERNSSITSAHRSLELLEVDYETPNNRQKFREPVNKAGVPDSCPVSSLETSRRVQNGTPGQTLMDSYLKKPKSPRPRTYSPIGITAKAPAVETPKADLEDCADILDKLYGVAWRQPVMTEPRRQVQLTDRGVQTDCVRKPRKIFQDSEDGSDGSDGSDGRSKKLLDFDYGSDGRSRKPSNSETGGDGRRLKVSSILNDGRDGRAKRFFPNLEDSSDGRSKTSSNLKNPSDGRTAKKLPHVDDGKRQNNLFANMLDENYGRPKSNSDSSSHDGNSRFPKGGKGVNSGKRIPKSYRKYRDSFIVGSSESEGSTGDTTYMTALTNPGPGGRNFGRRETPVTLNTKKAIEICDSDSEAEKDVREVDNRRKLVFSDNEDERSSGTSEYDPDDFVPPKPILPKVTTLVKPLVHSSKIPTRLPLPKPRCQTKSFLSSLSGSVPLEHCHQDAKRYRLNFKNTKEELVKVLYKLFNEKIFESKLPPDMLIEWNVRMRGTAGFCYNKKAVGVRGTTRSSRIALATKILDKPDRLRDTLVHEMCHAAAWLINEVADGHGAFWKSWAVRAMKAFPELPPIKRCHDYEIATKFTYRCMQCGYSIGRHSKSLDISKKRCGLCYGHFELLLNRVTKSGTMKQIPKTPNQRQPSAFALFVKENYSTVKSAHKGRAHKEVMQLLGQQFSAIKLSKQNNGRKSSEESP